MQDEDGAQQNDARDVSTSPGAMLKSARESQGLSVEQVAQDLHLDIWVIESLESDDFDSIGAPVFAKGHMRKYALVLGVPIEDLLAAYYRIHKPREAPPLVVSPRTRTRKGGRRSLIVLLVLLLFGLGAVGAWWLSRSDSTLAFPEPPSESPEPQPQSVSEPQPGIAVPAIEPEVEIGRAIPIQAEVLDEQLGEPPDQILGPTEAQTQLAELSEPTSDTPQEPPSTSPGIEVGTGAITVELRFSQDSWIEVYDVAGRRLMFGLGRADSQRSLVGQPPLEMFLGYVDGVQILVDGEPFEVPAARRSGNVARFYVDRAQSAD